MSPRRAGDMLGGVIQATSAIPAPGYAALSHPSLRFARFCRHTRRSSACFVSPKERYELAEKLMAARPPGKNSAIVGPRSAHSIHKPDFPPRFEKLGLALAKGRLRNEANNRLDGLEWGGGSTE
ncbi:hypothetical protein A0O28_0090130 [Trichoderma guizhouense]|uniref:Uncharacterized protein n=1 Tax=Trichoderma guizhouense TaxID=1491466 RepID=A0A1T3CV44_9HYPO|nr:hypothetical protein A0O28_0090130 [Trichoderma guizhouense]